jgi:hypothetical protein
MAQAYHRRAQGQGGLRASFGILRSAPSSQHPSAAPEVLVVGATQLSQRFNPFRERSGFSLVLLYLEAATGHL